MALYSRRAEVYKAGSLIFAAILVLVPFWVMVSISFKDLQQFLKNIMYPYPPVAWANYVAGWEAVGPYILNTVAVAAIVTAGSLTISSITAYVFARYDFVGKTALFYSLIALLMIPGVLNLIPQFVLARDLGILGGIWSLVLFYIAGRQVLEVYILRTFFTGVPKELFEAAQIDGAGDARQYWHIALPMSKSILGTLAIMTVVFVWNDYIWPLVAADDFMTVSRGLAYLTHQHSTSWGPLMAGYTLASIPLVVLFLFTMRYFVEGIATGAIKA
jgi:ABC-type glycerol-3-phosphate transport system permease component